MVELGILYIAKQQNAQDLNTIKSNYHCNDSLTQVFCCRNRDRDRSPRKERDRDRDRDRRDRERRHRDRDKGGDRERREVTLTWAISTWKNDTKH